MYNHHGQTLYTPVFPTAEKSDPLVKSLSHLHLALASVPAELAPPSRPPSPGFNSRRQVVYDNIRAAYNAVGGQTSHGGWTHVYRLVDMTCTRSRFKKSATRIERKDPEEGVPWILAETEEEWAEWEKAREKTKSRLRRTDTEVVDQQGHPSASGASSKQVNLRDKVASWKAQVDRSFHEDEDIVHEPKSSNPATTRGSRSSSTKKRASPLDFPVVKPSTLNAHRSDKAKGKEKQKPSKPVPKPDLPRHADFDGHKSPADVQPTSTSDPIRKPPSERKQDAPKPVLTPPSFSQAVTSTPKKLPGVPDDPSISIDALPPFSPPPKAGPSRMPPLGLTTPESQEAQRAAARKRFRPLSPPMTGDEPAGLTENDALPSAKRQKTTLSAVPTTRPVPPPLLGRNVTPKNLVTPTKKHGVFGSGLSISRTKETPLRPLGAAGGFEDVDDVEGLGRVTPKRRERSLTPLLASSHKVMPRPRPPSRKSSPLKKPRTPPPGTIQVDDDDDDMIPHDSPKACFSSPASSTSSTSEPRRKGPQSPGSPSLLILGHSNPNFTVNPETFAPFYTSTQNGPEGDGLGGDGRALSRKGTGNSAGLFKFNSQFDLDKNVDEAMALLERDVDADNWFVDLGGDMDLTVGADD